MRRAQHIAGCGSPGMRRSRFSWAVGALAPWCLGGGMLISFTASAGIDASSGGSISALTARPAVVATPVDLVPDSGFTPSRLFHMRNAAAAALIESAALTLGPDGEFRTLPDEIEPRSDMKAVQREFPMPDRSKKGDPVVGLRPTFDTRLREGGGIHRAAQSLLLFGRDYLAFEGFQKDVEEDVAETEDPTPGDERGRTASPASTGGTDLTSASPRLVAGGAQRHFDGATPRVSRAAAPGSNTPFSAGDSVLVVAAPSVLPGATAAPNTTLAARTARPDYATLIEDAKSPEQRKCLAEPIYFEARSESEDGQAAVAQVVLNRALSGLYPASV